LPTYEYRCVSCEHQFERFQRMSDEPVKVCEKCGEPVRRLLFPVAIQFKGNGFYTTDYARRSTIGSGASRGAESDSPSTTSCATAESSKTESSKTAASTPADSTSKSD
jgi:putative FmdB family regulatory protein